VAIHTVTWHASMMTHGSMNDNWQGMVGDMAYRWQAPILMCSYGADCTTECGNRPESKICLAS
jgi:hypothetical protein